MELAVRVLGDELVGGAHRERGLAAAAHAVQSHDFRPLLPFLRRAAQQFGHLDLAAGEVGEVVGQGAGRLGRERGGDGRRSGGLRTGQFRALAQDALVQPGQVRARVDAEFLDEKFADLAVLLQGLGLPSGAVQGEHQLAAQGLTQRVLGDQLPEVRDELAGLAEGEAEAEVLLPHGQPAFLDAGGGRLDDRSPDTGQHRTAPQRQGPA